MDKYEEAVGQAVVALRKGEKDEIIQSFEALSVLAIDELLAELGLWVEDVTLNKDTDRLLALAVLPLPEEPAKLIEVSNVNDIKELHAYCKGDLVILISSLMMLIASLQEAGERL